MSLTDMYKMIKQANDSLVRLTGTRYIAVKKIKSEHKIAVKVVK